MTIPAQQHQTEYNSSKDIIPLLKLKMIIVIFNDIRLWSLECRHIYLRRQLQEKWAFVS